jgi:hypothetical protein
MQGGPGVDSLGLFYLMEYDSSKLPDALRCRIKMERMSPRCWLWLGALSDGYGTSGGVTKLIRNKYGISDAQMHVIVYRILVGTIPIGFHLHHKCEVRRCCNPSHLEPLSPGDHRKVHAERMRAIRRICTVQKWTI